MSFKDLKLKLIYDNSTEEITDDLIVPLLEESKVYYRGVGYFSSNWIQIVAQGLHKIAENGGKIYLITSPNLSADDWEAMKRGKNAEMDEILYETIKRNINEDFDISTRVECLNLLSWLIADNILTMKFAICKNGKGMYHDKLAIFEDYEDNKVCLHGSFNDSLQATYNGEGFSVFKSCESGQKAYVDEHFARFQAMWKGLNHFYEIYDIPELVKVELRKYQKKERPYRKSKKTLNLPVYINELNNYQIEAIKNLKTNNWRGILEMATGTGKTITSIAASMEYLSIKGRIFLIVVVPFNHLVKQWEDNILSFGYKAPIKCYDSKEFWYGKLNRRIKDYNIRLTDCESLIVSYKTFSSSDFQELCSKIKDNAFFVADECHYIGSASLRDCMPDNFDVRVGLSATPDRWFDEDGTYRLRNYFGDTIFEYDMKMAIDNGFLCKYEYEPTIVSLTPDEYEKYSALTKTITRMLLANDKKIHDSSILQRKILKRAEILAKAENKIPTFIKMLKQEMMDGEVSHTLVYCAKGESQKITKFISELGIRTHEFVYKVSNTDRQKILESFAKGDIQVLVAIKCLDEGVDVPGTRIAYFLSSTSNPREFIQRRGRILRRSPGKHLAKIIDFLVFPMNKPLSKGGMDTVDNSIIEKEMPRFAEFSRYAFNSGHARGVIRKYLAPHNLEYLMDKLPWQVYKERKEKYSYEQQD